MLQRSRGTRHPQLWFWGAPAGPHGPDGNQTSNSRWVLNTVCQHCLSTFHSTTPESRRNSPVWKCLNIISWLGSRLMTCQTEVNDLDLVRLLSLVHQHHVLRFQVGMDDTQSLQVEKCWCCLITNCVITLYNVNKIPQRLLRSRLLMWRRMKVNRPVWWWAWFPADWEGRTISPSSGHRGFGPSTQILYKCNPWCERLGATSPNYTCQDRALPAFWAWKSEQTWWTDISSSSECSSEQWLWIESSNE